MAFNDYDGTVNIHSRTSGNVFTINRMAAKTMTSVNLVQDQLYSNDCDLLAHTKDDMQRLIEAFNSTVLISELLTG